MCAIYKSEIECTYNPNSDRRRIHTRQQVEKMAQSLQKLEGLFSRIRTCSEEDLAQLLKKIRSDSDRNISKDDDLTRLVDALQIDADGELHYFGDSSNLTLLGKATTQDEEASLSPSPLTANTPRQNVGTEIHFDYSRTEYLLELYWTWQDPYFKILSKDLFLRDKALNDLDHEAMAPKRKFYSEFLFFAILAHMSHLVPDDSTRSDPTIASSSGDVYYSRCRELVDTETLRPNLCFVQGCLLLGSREAGLGRQSRGWIWSGMAFRASLDLGLHVCFPGWQANLQTDTGLDRLQ